MKGLVNMGFHVEETNLEFGALRPRMQTNFFVLHHTATEGDTTAEEIHQMHLNQGWSGIGYHFVILKNGTVQRGRPRGYIGAHAKGYNYESIGINIAGNFETEEPTAEQIEAVAKLLSQLCEIYELEPSDQTIIGHRDLMATACPGQNLYDILSTIRGKTIWYMQNGVDA